MSWQQQPPKLAEVFGFTGPRVIGQEQKIRDDVPGSPTRGEAAIGRILGPATLEEFTEFWGRGPDGPGYTYFYWVHFD